VEAARKLRERVKEVTEVHIHRDKKKTAEMGPSRLPAAGQRDVTASGCTRSRCTGYGTAG
jgi:hypothetical protein